MSLFLVEYKTNRLDSAENGRVHNVIAYINLKRIMLCFAVV